MRIILYLIIIVIALNSCGDSGDPETTDKPPVNTEKDSLSAITNHIVTDIQALNYALEIADDFDTISLADRIESDTTIFIRNKNNLLIHGDYAEIALSGLKMPLLVIDSCNNLTIEGINLFFDSLPEYNSGLVNIVSGKNIVLKKNKIHNSSAYAIKTGKTADSVFVIENHLFDCGKFALSICSSNSVVSKNTFYNNYDGYSNLQICKDAEKTALIDTNYNLVANHDEYCANIENEINSGVLSTLENMSPDGIEKTTGYFADNLMLCLKYVYSEEDMEKWDMYFKDGKMLFVRVEKTTFMEDEKGETIEQKEISKYSYLLGKLAKWEMISNENDTTLVSDSEFAKKANELNITINTLVGMIPLESKTEL